MKVNLFFLASNPFFDAYIHSDFLGKLIFIGLIALSICSWIILIHKVWLTYRARKHSAHFHESFQLQRLNPLSLECENSPRRKMPNPFMDLYLVLKKHTVDILNKNKRFGKSAQESSPESGVSYLSPVRYRFRRIPSRHHHCHPNQKFGKKPLYPFDNRQFGPFFGVAWHRLGDIDHFFRNANPLERQYPSDGPWRLISCLGNDCSWTDRCHPGFDRI